MPVHPKRRAAGGIVGLAVASTLLIAGCVGPSEVPPSPAATVAAPVFASDDEALAAAEAAYADYLAMSDLIAQEGGRDPERIAGFATQDIVESAIDGAAVFSSEGYVMVGSSTYRDAQLQYFTEDAGTTTVGVLLCNDISATDVLDSTGRSIVGPDRKNTTLLFVELTATGDPKSLRVSKREPWNDDSC